MNEKWKKKWFENRINIQVKCNQSHTLLCYNWLDSDETSQHERCVYIVQTCSTQRHRHQQHQDIQKSAASPIERRYTFATCTEAHVYYIEWCLYVFSCHSLIHDLLVLLLLFIGIRFIYMNGEWWLYLYLQHRRLYYTMRALLTAKKLNQMFFARDGANLLAVKQRQRQWSITIPFERNELRQNVPQRLAVWTKHKTKLSWTTQRHIRVYALAPKNTTNACVRSCVYTRVCVTSMCPNECRHIIVNIQNI